MLAGRERVSGADRLGDLPVTVEIRLARDEWERLVASAEALGCTVEERIRLFAAGCRAGDVVDREAVVRERAGRHIR